MNRQKNKWVSGVTHCPLKLKNAEARKSKDKMSELSLSNDV